VLILLLHPNTKITLEIFIDKNMSMSWYSSSISKTVDGVLMWIFRVYPPSTATYFFLVLLPLSLLCFFLPLSLFFLFPLEA